MVTSIDNEPITPTILILIGYTKVNDYYCAPPPADGSTYRLEFQATAWHGNTPIKGTEEWRAYLTNSDLSTIRRFKTVGELNHFHKGMCGEYLPIKTY